MKVSIILTGPGGELDNVTINVKDETDPAISEAVVALASSTLCPGDTITIKEVE